MLEHEGLEKNSPPKESLYGRGIVKRPGRSLVVYPINRDYIRLEREGGMSYGSTTVKHV